MSKISELSDGGSLLPTDFLIAVRSGGNVKVQADQTEFDRIRLGDNEKIELGNSQDMQLYHDGSASRIVDAGTGSLKIQAENFAVNNVGDTENMITAVPDGAVSLFFDGSTKIATSAIGATISGSVTADALTVNGIINTDLQSSSAWTTNTRALQITTYGAVSSNDSLGNVSLTSNAYESGNGTWSRVAATSAARYQIDYQGNSTWSSAIAAVGDSAISWLNRMNIASNGDISFYEDTGTTAKLFWDASAESLTVTGGIISNGQIPALIASSAFSDYIVGGNKARFAVVGDATGTAGEIIFSQYSSNGSVGRDSVIIDSSGNVGIGVSSINANLEIRGSSSNGQVRLGGSTSGVYGKLYSDNDGVLIVSADAGNAAANSYFGVEVDGSEAMRIDSLGNVGIGCTPSAKLDIVATGQATEISTAAGQTHIGLTDTTNSKNAFINYNNDILQYFSHGPTERLRIDSSGNLLVGTTDSTPYNNSADSAADNGIAAGAGLFSAARYQGSVALLNRTGNDGEIIGFKRSGAHVGSIGTKTSMLTIGSGDVGLYFDSANNRIIPFNTTTQVNNDAVFDVGAAAYRFKDAYLSGGIYLGGTAAANKLSDFETGTFTPTWTPASGSGQTISAASGWYTKTGNRVFVDIHLATNGLGTASGDLSLGGLPFTQTTNSGQNASLACGQAANAGLVAGQACAARVNQSATTITPLVWSATTGTTTMTAAQWGVSGTWRFTGSYQV